MLHAVDDPTAVGFLPGGTKRRWIRQKIIRSIVRLGNTDRQHSAGIVGERRQHARLLFCVERLLHDLRYFQRLRHDHRNADVAPAQLFDHHRRRQRIRSETAPFLAERHGSDTDRIRLFDDLPGKTLLGILLGIKRRRSRLHLGINETFDRLYDEALVFSQDENILHDRLFALVHETAVVRISIPTCFPAYGLCSTP